MVLKVEHPLVDDCRFHDGNSASLRSVQFHVFNDSSLSSHVMHNVMVLYGE